MDRQVGQFFIRKILLIGVLDVICNALSTSVMLFAVFHDQLPEHFVPFALGILHDLILEKALGKVTQMNHKAVEVQGLPVKLLLIEIFHNRNGSLNELGDLVHLAHICVQLCIHNMQSNKCCFILMECNTQLLTDDSQTILAKIISASPFFGKHRVWSSAIR